MIISDFEKSFIKSILSETELDLINDFLSNPNAVEAVKKVLMIPMFQTGVLKKNESPNFLINFLLPDINRIHDMTDEEIGQATRGKTVALTLLESGFSYLEALQYQGEKVEPKRIASHR